MPFLILAALGAIAFIIFKSQQEPDAMPENSSSSESIDRFPFEGLFRKYGDAYGIDYHLIAAHAAVESSFNPTAVKHERSSSGKAIGDSTGLMQILLPVSVNKGAKRLVDLGRLPEWTPEAFAAISDPDVNIMLGASLIRENIALFGLPKAIAVYNSDNATTAKPAGPFPNQAYVNKVRAKLLTLTKDFP